MNEVRLNSFPDDNALATAAAESWLGLLVTAGAAHNPFFIALSGGRIARKLYSSFVCAVAANKTDISRIHFFWADERCLPPDHAESNYRLAKEMLFEPLSIPGSNVHRVLGEEETAFAAIEAEGEICRIAPLNENGQPILDLVILGLGEDGHVASLFPRHVASDLDSRRAYFPVLDSPKPPLERVTLSHVAISSAQRVWVLASGIGKSEALRASLQPAGLTPLGRVIKSRKETVIFHDFPV
jgi:6-phosphogluconolactonase